MTTINEEVAAQLALVDYLEADVTLMGIVSGVYLSVPINVQTPWVKIDRLEASDLMVVAGHRVWSRIVYNIRGQSKGPDWTDVQAIANRLDTLLHRQTITVDGLYVQDIIRIEPLVERTIESGTLYFHAGGLYELTAQAA